MANQRAQLRLEHVASGLTINTFLSATLKDAWLEPLGSLEVEIAPPDTQWSTWFRTLVKGEAIQFFINGASQGLYLIQERKTKLGAKGGRTFKLQCETYLCTAHEANVDPDYGINANSSVPIERVVLKVMAPYFTDPPLTSAVAHVEALSGQPLPGGQALPFPLSALKASASKASAGESKQAFVNKLVTRLGVVMRVDGNGRLMLVAPNYTQGRSWSVGASSTRLMTPDFDVFYGDIDLVETNKGQFSQARVIGQGNQSPPVGNAGVTTVSRPKPSAVLAQGLVPNRCLYQSSVHPLKEIVFKDKHSTDTTTCLSSAQLILGEHASKAYVITGMVDGWTNKSGAVWTTDTQGRVKIDDFDLDETFWLSERELHMTKEGEAAKLTAIPSGALILGPKPGT
jgi:hypothetical protein